MNILQEIFTDHYEEIKYTLHPRPAEMENIDKMINCGDPSYGGAMYGCIHCGNLKMFLSVVTAVSALPAVINIPWIALPLCPLSSLMSDTVIAFLPLMRPSVIFSCRIALSLTVSFIPSPVLSFAYSLK